MKTILLITVMMLSQMLLAQGDYLKITLDENREINYPGDLKFQILDEQGRELVNQDSIQEEYEATEEVKLKIFTTWNEKPDVFTLKPENSVQIARYDYKEDRERNKMSYSTYDESWYDYQQGDWNNDQEKVRPVQKVFMQTADGKQNNATIKFNNGIVFSYQDGVASFTRNGKELEYTGRYILTTEKGQLKISYNPYNTEFYYVFVEN